MLEYCVRVNVYHKNYRSDDLFRNSPGAGSTRKPFSTGRLPPSHTSKRIRRTYLVLLFHEYNYSLACIFISFF